MSDSLSEHSAIASDSENDGSFSEAEDRRSLSERSTVQKARPSRQRTLPAKFRDSHSGVDSLEELQIDSSSECINFECFLHVV